MGGTMPQIEVSPDLIALCGRLKVFNPNRRMGGAAEVELAIPIFPGGHTDGYRYVYGPET
jgi:hypothetical protein